MVGPFRSATGFAYCIATSTLATKANDTNGNRHTIRYEHDTYLQYSYTLERERKREYVSQTVPATIHAFAMSEIHTFH